MLGLQLLVPAAGEDLRAEVVEVAEVLLLKTAADAAAVPLLQGDPAALGAAAGLRPPVGAEPDYVELPRSLVEELDHARPPSIRPWLTRAV